MLRSASEKKVLINFVVIILLYISVFLLLPANSFWCSDNVNKYFQAESILHNNFSSSDLMWKGREIWNNPALNPISTPFAVVKDNRIVSMFPPLFSFITAAILLITGNWGIYLLALAGTIIILRSIYKISILTGFSTNLALTAVWLTFTATPILFYTFTFWEHTLVTGFCLWATERALIYKQKTNLKNLILFVITMTPAIYLRDVAIIFGASISLLLLWQVHRKEILKHGFKLGSLFFIALIPLLLINFHLIGEALGPHLSYHIKTSSSFTTHMKDRIPVLYNLFASSFSNIAAAVSYLTINISAIILINFNRNKISYPKFIRVYFAILSFLTLIILGAFISGISNPFYSISLWGVTPFLFAGFLKTDNSDNNFLKKLILLYIFIYAAFAPYVGSAGFHWGCRFLLTAYPLLLITTMGFFIKQKDKIFRVCFSVAAITSILLQIYSLSLLNTRKHLLREFDNYIATRPEQAVILLHKRYGNDLPFSLQEKFIFNITNNEQKKELKTLLKRIKDKGHSRILIVTTPQMFRHRQPIKAVITDKHNIRVEYKIFSFTIDNNYNLK